MNIRIVLNENRPLVQQAMLSILEENPEVDVVDTPIDEEQFLASVEKNSPDVVIFNTRAWSRAPLAVIKNLKSICPDVTMLALIDLDRSVLVSNFLERGVLGCLLDTDQMTLSLDSVVHSLVEGKRVYSIDLMDQIVSRSDLEIDEVALEILALLASGLTNQAIADKLGLSEATVRSIVSKTYERLGITTAKGRRRRILASMKARDLGLA